MWMCFFFLCLCTSVYTCVCVDQYQKNNRQLVYVTSGCTLHEKWTETITEIEVIRQCIEKLKIVNYLWLKVVTILDQCVQTIEDQSQKNVPEVLPEGDSPDVEKLDKGQVNMSDLLTQLRAFV
jgi:hypothetical protein